MGQIKVCENVDVAATFSGGQVTPLKFAFEGRAVTVDQVLRRWQGEHAGIHYHYCEVEAGGRVYVLCFNSREVSWMVKADV
jgi:hypothetical protein